MGPGTIAGSRVYGVEATEPRHGCRPLPAWACDARRVRDLRLSDVRCHHTDAAADPRPAYRTEHVDRLTADRVFPADPWPDSG